MKNFARENPIFDYIFNFYDVMVMMSAVMAVLLIIPLLLKREKHASDYWLSAFLFSQGATSLNIIFLYNETLGPLTFETLFPFHYTFLRILYGVQGFLLLCYVKAMMGEKNRIVTKITAGACLIFIVLMVVEISITLRFPKVPVQVLLGSIFFQILSIILGIYALYRLRLYDKKIRHNYSNIEQVKLKWLWFTALGFVCVWGLVLSSSVIGAFGFYNFAIQLGTIANLPPVFLMSAMVIYGQSLPINATLFDPDQPDHANSKAEESIVIATSEQQAQIEDLMLRVKIYQDPELRLEGLADSLDISPRTVSSLLNGYYQKNFYDFINFYRVKDAQQQLEDPNNKSKTIQRVFEDAGFNSKTTFNTLFKKITGKTPTEYRSQTS